MAITKKKITELTAATPASTDYVPFVDVTTDAQNPTTKKATVASLQGSASGDMNTSVYDPATKSEQVLTVSDISDTAYDATSWNGVTNVAPSKNAVRDMREALDAAKQDVITDSDDITEGSTNLFLTSAERTIIGNTSGTNTGDQDLSTYQLKPSEGAFANGDKTKLDGIETGADVTDTTNVTAAGALMDSELTDITAIKAASDASASDVNTGTSTTAFVTPDALAGSVLGTKGSSVQITDGSGAIEVGDGAFYMRVTSEMAGMNLVDVNFAVTAPSTSGAITFQVARGRQASPTSAHSYVDMLSTACTIDANEYDSKDATTAAVINTSNDDLAEGDIIRVDIDGVGTGPTAIVLFTPTFQLP